MDVICRLSAQIDRVTQRFIQVALAIIVMLFILEVFARNVFRSSLTWVDEVSVTYLGTWFVFIGAAHAMKAGMLISFDSLLPRLPARLRASLFFVTQSLILVFLAVIIVFGLRLSAFTMSQPSAALQLPMGVAYLGVVVGCLLMVVHSLAAIVDKMKDEPNQ